MSTKTIIREKIDTLGQTIVAGSPVVFIRYRKFQFGRVKRVANKTVRVNWMEGGHLFSRLLPPDQVIVIDEDLFIAYILKN
jgi:hypothetical protein